MLAKSRFLLAVGLLTVGSATAPAQVAMPKVDTRPIPWTPQYQNPAFPWQKQQQPQKGTKNQIYVMPSINTVPGIPASTLFPPIFQNPTWLDPTLNANNTWMNLPGARPNPFLMNLMNPMFTNPFEINPLLQRAAWFNQFNMPYYRPQASLSEWGLGPVAPVVSYSPPIAIREPGQYIYKGFDLQVNPTTGTVYRPQTGVVTLADGTTFYRVPGTGQPSVNGFYATGTGTYYNPNGGTYFNPSTGIISKPAQANVFMPYVW